MRSKRGLWASLVFFLAPLLAVATDAFPWGNPNAAAHLVWALGLALLAGALLGFDTPRWIARTGCLAAAGTGLLFLVQGISDLVSNTSLHRIAYSILGEIPERVLVDLLIASFVGLLLTDSRGRSRVLGWVVMTLVVVLEIAALITQLLGQPLYESVPALRLVLLLPLVWLLCESVKRSPNSGEPTEAEPRAVPTPAAPPGSHRKR
jgi:hypothetical protein